MMEEESLNYTELAQSIADGETILILGPNAIPFYHIKGGSEGTGFGQRTQDRILEVLNDKIIYNKRDNLIQFADINSKTQAMKEVRDVARDPNWLPDVELLRQIIAIPFPVIVNLNPDKAIYKAFVTYYREPQFDFFTTKAKEPFSSKVDYPDGLNNPLVYNLCGSVLDKLDSVVLDYNDLFVFLKNLLMDIGVPEALNSKFQEADRFILLGFDLDRWYAQLLLHYLNKPGDNSFANPNQNFPILSRMDEDESTFIMEQFNIRYLAQTRADFEKLYYACEKEGLLRNLLDASSPIEVQIRMQIVQGKYEEAFNLLDKNLDAAAQNLDLPHLRARYNDWLKHKREGIADSRDLELELNRIRYTLLTYANQISES